MDIKKCNETACKSKDKCKRFTTDGTGHPKIKHIEMPDGTHKCEYFILGKPPKK